MATYSEIDEIITPRESGLFRGYLPNSFNVETWNNSKQFTEDLIGLGTLLKQGKLFTFTSHVKHQDVTHQPNKDFFMQNILSFFNNTPQWAISTEHVNITHLVSNTCFFS